MALPSLLLASPSDPADQTSWAEIPIWRNYGDTLYVRVTDTNCVGVGVCPDSLDGNATADTAGTCFQLEYETSSMSWKAPIGYLYPNSNISRQSFTVYLLNAGAGADTLVRSGVRLDLGAPVIGSVDSAAVAAGALSAVHFDSTGTFIGSEFQANQYELRQVGGSGVGLSAPWGTADATGDVIQITGGSAGDAISIPSWIGRFLAFTRGAAGNSAHGIVIDMSAEPYTGGAVHSISLDAGGDGTVNGLVVVRDSGSRAATTYGVYSGIDSGATQSAATGYAGYFKAEGSVSGAGAIVGLQAKADTSGVNRALRTEGDAEIGTAETDSTIFHGELRLYDNLMGEDSSAVSLHTIAIRDSIYVGRFLDSGDSMTVRHARPDTLTVNGSLYWSFLAGDTLLFSTDRTLAGDRVFSEYVPGALIGDLVTTGISCAACGDSANAHGFWVKAVNDSIQTGWDDGMDGYILNYEIKRR